MEKIKFPKKTVDNVFRKNFYEKKAWRANTVVCGIDEVGRGCLAGPLVAAAAILPPGKHHNLLKDSKTLTQRELLLAYRWITKHCKYSLGIISNRDIDKFNIWQSTLIAMKKASLHILANTNIKPSVVLVDAVPLNLSNTTYGNIPVYNFTKGESKSTSIAAASIVAKVERDRIMGKLDAVFPGYHFKNHKGYGTKKHIDLVEKQKHTIIHRVSFLNKAFIDEDYECQKQLTLC